MIEIEHLYKERTGLTLQDINLKFETGTLNLLVAKNSGGKSTLLKLIAGAIPSYDGVIKLYNQSIQDYKKTDSIGYVPSHMPLDKNVQLDNIGDMMEYTFVNWDRNYFNELLKMMRISSYQKVHELSKGYAKLLMLAIALAHRPKIYLLDEPTLGLDAKHKVLLSKLLEMMLEDGLSTVLVASNAIEDFEGISDQLVFLEEGRVAYAGAILDLQERYAIWKGLSRDLPNVRTYGKIRHGDMVEVLVDCDTKGSVKGSVKEIIILLGGKS